MTTAKTYWNIDSENGNSLSEGIQSESEARRFAQNAANELGESVYLYEVGDGDGESEVDAEEITPEESCEHGHMDGDTCSDCGETCSNVRDGYGNCIDTECPIHGEN